MRIDQFRIRFRLIADTSLPQCILVGFIASGSTLDRSAQQQQHHMHHHRHKITPTNVRHGSGAGHSWAAGQPDVETDVEKRVKTTGWTTWSDWSTCSRSCDGGIAQQLRRCLAPHGCRGEPVRYKICNMQVSNWHLEQRSGIESRVSSSSIDRRDAIFSNGKSLKHPETAVNEHGKHLVRMNTFEAGTPQCMSFFPAGMQCNELDIFHSKV